MQHSVKVLDAGSNPAGGAALCQLFNNHINGGDGIVNNRQKNF